MINRSKLLLSLAAVTTVAQAVPLNAYAYTTSDGTVVTYGNDFSMSDDERAADSKTTHTGVTYRDYLKDKGITMKDNSTETVSKKYDDVFDISKGAYHVHFYKNGEMVKNSWVKGKFYFDENGDMVINKWISWNGSWYFIKADGTYAHDTYINGYYLDDKGAWDGSKDDSSKDKLPDINKSALNCGNLSYDKFLECLNKKTIVPTKLYDKHSKESFIWEYVGPEDDKEIPHEDGYDISDGAYHIHYYSNGKMEKDSWVGRYHYFDENGDMVLNKWINWNGKWYFIEPDGSYARNIYIHGYYLGEDGAWDSSKDDSSKDQYDLLFVPVAGLIKTTAQDFLNGINNKKIIPMSEYSGTGMGDYYKNYSWFYTIRS